MKRHGTGFLPFYILSSFVCEREENSAPAASCLFLRSWCACWWRGSCRRTISC